MGTSCQRRSDSWRWRSTTPSSSCPSAKTSALTSNVSPTVRLTGNLPQWMHGRMDSTTARRLPSTRVLTGATVPSWGVRKPRGGSLRRLGDARGAYTDKAQRTVQAGDVVVACGEENGRDPTGTGVAGERRG